MNNITLHNNRIWITDTSMKFLTCNTIIQIDTDDKVDNVMSLRTHQCMMVINPLTQVICFKLISYHINICIIVKILLLTIFILL
ncbi:hypothetical protein Hanom_Chr01g00010601 [Helianthus anomalus]